MLICSEIVSCQHGEFLYSHLDDTFYYVDKNSANGTYINGIKLKLYNSKCSYAHKLVDGDIIRIFSRGTYNSVVIVFCRGLSQNDVWKFCTIPYNNAISIGRKPGCRICLSDMAVSREHAFIKFFDPQNLMIFDNNSQNGIFVNGQRVIRRKKIYNYDVIRIANSILLVVDDKIFYNNAGEKSDYALSVNIREKNVNFGKRILLKNISFAVNTSDFVLILGGSGVGKTTLINAILGDGKVNGEVRLNGLDLYANFKDMKSQIGLIPQFLNLRVNDKVRQTLMDIAEVKLDKRYYSKRDKIRRVNAVMNTLGIKELQNHLIRQLSGGQKKKVSVAAQLIGFQKVFICDEPDSGLDAASRVQQMEILKAIADNGRIVMVISHEPDDAVSSQTEEILFTKVLVLAKSSYDNAGHLAFYGSPYDALRFFGVSRLQDIMKVINPPQEGGKGLADYFIEKFST